MIEFLLVVAIVSIFCLFWLIWLQIQHDISEHKRYNKILEKDFNRHPDLIPKNYKWLTIDKKVKLMLEVMEREG